MEVAWLYKNLLQKKEIRFGNWYIQILILVEMRSHYKAN